MKFYFCGAIKGGREKQKDYKEIIEFLDTIGEVLDKHVGMVNTTIENEIKYSNKEEEHVYIRDTRWIDQSDVIVADVTIPSLGVGYEIGYAESKSKKIICLFDVNSNNKLSYMICGNEKNEIIEYKNIDEIKDKLKIILKEEE